MKRILLLTVLLLFALKGFSEIDTTKEPQLIVENSAWKAKAWGRGESYKHFGFSEIPENTGVFYYSDKVEKTYSPYFKDYAYVEIESKMEGIKGQKSELYRLYDGGYIYIVHYEELKLK